MLFKQVGYLGFYLIDAFVYLLYRTVNCFHLLLQVSPHCLEVLLTDAVCYLRYSLKYCWCIDFWHVLLL